MTITELVIAALAVWEIIEIWNHGSMFASYRAILELYDTWWSSLLSCGFCLTPWVSWLVVPVLLWLVPIHWAFGIIPYGFAVARLANLGNDVFHDMSRTPTVAKDVMQTEPLQDMKEHHDKFGGEALIPHDDF